MKNFKTFFQEGISRKPVAKFGGKSILDYLIDVNGMVTNIDQHQKSSPHERHFSVDPESQHVFNSALHPEIQKGNFGASNYSLSGIIKHEQPDGKKVKIHIIHGDTNNQTGWGGLYVGTSVKHHQDSSNTLHVPLLISRNAYAGPVGTTHELTHALQDLSGADFFWNAHERGRRGSGTKHSSHVGKLVYDSQGNRHFSQPQPPKGRRAKVNTQNEGAPWKPWGSNYFHQGIELNARMMQKIPEIIHAVSQHHQNQGYADFVKQHSNRIQTEAAKIKSEEAKKRYKEQHYDKMFDSMASDIKTIGLGSSFASNPNLGDASLTKVKNPRGAIAVRNEKLKEKQNKNLWSLVSYIHEKQINDLIRHHSGHNVLENRKTREQERNRLRTVQSVKPTEEPQKSTSISTQTVEPAEQPKKKPSAVQRFKKFLGIR